ncbi:hypothetical protein [Microbulbifer taiwanensis]|uniref:hypothetical protein n=1 Tax=Microbulbifer taiwanensis TaxID=986746 RepID=UPI00361242DF
MAEFIDTVLICGPDHRASDETLWGAYRLWAAGNGYQQMPRRRMLTALADALRWKGARRAASVLVDGKRMRGFYGVGVTESTGELSEMWPHFLGRAGEKRAAGMLQNCCKNCCVSKNRKFWEFLKSLKIFKARFSTEPCCNCCIFWPFCCVTAA